MRVREINKTELLYNIDTMINTLEYDSMRSAGKTKVNCGLLVNLYTLKDIYKKYKQYLPKSRKQF